MEERMSKECMTAGNMVYSQYEDWIEKTEKKLIKRIIEVQFAYKYGRPATSKEVKELYRVYMGAIGDGVFEKFEDHVDFCINRLEQDKIKYGR